MMPITDDEPQIGERTRLAELIQIMGRHGLNGLASRLGLLPGSSQQSVDVGTPERVIALLQDLGPVAVKLGQVLATREDLLGPEWVRALSTLPRAERDARLRALGGRVPSGGETNAAPPAPAGRPS